MTTAMVPTKNPKAGTREKPLEADDIIDAGRPLTINVSSTARAAYASVCRSGKQAGRAVVTAAKMADGRLDEWPAFVRELFSRMYDPDGSTPLSDNELSPWGMRAMGIVEASKEWEQLREAAMVSRNIAAAATAEIAFIVHEALDIKNLNDDAKKDPRELREEMQALANVAAQHGASEQEIGDLLSEASDQLAKCESARRRLDAAAHKDPNRLRIVGAIQRAASRASGEAEKVRLFSLLGFSREGPGSMEEVAPDLASVDTRMLCILRYVGRFKDAADSIDAKTSGSLDVVGVNPTRDLAKATPRTLAMIASGGMRGLSTMRDLMDGAAQGWEQQGMAPRNKGDAIILIDRSGSMSGDREHRARAMGVAAMLAMIEQGRRCVAGSFAGHQDCTLATVKPGDMTSVAAGLKAICKQADGGTDVDYALDRSCSMISEDMREPDALVITDGEFDPVDESVLKRLGDVRLFGLMLEEGIGEGHPEFDAVWEMPHLTPENAAQAIKAMRSTRKARR